MAAIQNIHLSILILRKAEGLSRRMDRAFRIGPPFDEQTYGVPPDTDGRSSAEPCPTCVW